MPGRLHDQARTGRRRRAYVAVAGISALAFATAGAAGLGAGVAAGAGAPGRTGPARMGAPAVAPSGSRLLGALAGSTVLHVDVLLAPRDPAALASAATSVSNPASPLYQHYLPAGAFSSVYGPKPAAVAAVEASLRAEGLRPGAISGDRLILPVTATASALGRAFSTGFVRYEVGGRVAYANTRAPLFPAAVVGYVEGVVGLDSLAVPRPLGILQPQRSAHPAIEPHVVTGGPQPCAAAKSAGSSQFSFTADQIASAYSFPALYKAGDLGAGQTVAIFELEKNSTSDIAAYQSCYKTSAAVSYVKVSGGATGGAAGSGEAALDIEDVIGLAPKASIIVYQAPNTNAGLLADYGDIVSQDKAKVITTSWGECESLAGTTITGEENTLFEEAAIQGQSMFAAAGDDGSSDCGKASLAVDDPGSQPWVTGVGGTHLSISGSTVSQTVWNESLLQGGAGGGGVSARWTMPAFQSSAPASLNVKNSHSSGTPCKATSGDCREVPDVSADADEYSGYVIYYSGNWMGIGGTSAAAPFWAAFMSLTNADTACKAAIGFANPALYRVAGTSYSKDFTDIKSGNNDYTPDGYSGGLYPSGTGYDMASGLGTPIGSALAASLCAAGTGSNKVTVTNPGSQSTATGASVNLQIHATDSASGQTLVYAARAVPAGIKLNHATGQFTGAPTTAGTSSVTVIAMDATGAKGSATFTWTVT